MKIRQALSVLVGVLVGATLALSGGALATRAQAAAPVSEIGTFAKLAEAVGPAVINVATQRKASGASRMDPFQNGPERGPRRGIGSGVIIDPSGLALTNAHVVDGATQVEVTLHDGSTHSAKVVGVDTKTDLAVLKIDGGSKFPFLPLGDSSTVQVGDWVIAVGSPFGLQATVTSGIVSAKARHIGAGPYDDFLQTDAAINPGNSGGPLVNMRGEVIGINTAIVRGGSGIGFAIPAEMAKRVATQLAENGKVTRGWLGVSMQPLTPDLAASFGTQGKKGALIADVVEGSPAERAGLKAGDVVLAVDGQSVTDPGDVARKVGLAAPGRTETLTVWRDNSQRQVQVVLGEAPGERQASRLGLEVAPVTQDVARELNRKSTAGVVVTDVAEDSPAAEAGIQRGDVIVEVNHKPVKALADFERATRELKKDERVMFRVERGDAALYVAVTPESA
jgi:serine protease Do